jgi:hypothetical protein
MCFKDKQQDLTDYDISDYPSKDLFKLMNNSIYGKTMQNNRKHQCVKLDVTCFNSAIEVTIISSFADNPPPSVSDQMAKTEQNL